MKKNKRAKERIKRHAERKALRRKNKKFKNLHAVFVDGFYVLEFNGRHYRNASKKGLLDDIATVENG